MPPTRMRERGISRACLQVLLETRHPVGIVTKGALITRDLDLLAALAQQGVVSVFVSVTALDNRLSAKLEPRAAAPQRAEHVMSLIRQMRGGKDYDSALGTCMRGHGPFAQLIAARFARTCKRLGFRGLPGLRTDLFVAPKCATPRDEWF